MIGNTELLTILSILLFVVIFIFLIRASRKSGEEKTIQAHAPRFEPLAEQPPELLARLEELFQNQHNKKVELRNLYHQREFARDLYLFDLVNTHHEDTSSGTEVFRVISHQLTLPRFSLSSFPPLDTQRMLGNLMDKMLTKFFDWVGKFQRLTRVEFPDQPGFDEKFVVFGGDKYTLRKLFSGTIARDLSRSMTPFQVSGSGNFLTIDYSSISSPINQESILRTRYQEHLNLVQPFEERQ